MKFNIKKPAKKELLTVFQEEFLQELLNIKINSIKNNSNSFVLINTTDGYLPDDSYIKWDYGRGFFNNDYLNNNTEKFKKELLKYPVKTNALVKRLQNDLGNDFEVQRVRTGVHDLNQIIISWE